MNAIHTTLGRNGFVRPTDGRVVGGVCAGLARRYGLDAWAVRILLVLTLVLIPGSQILLYPIAWILMPAEMPVARPDAMPYPRPDAMQYPQAQGPQDAVA